MSFMFIKEIVKGKAKVFFDFDISRS